MKMTEGAGPGVSPSVSTNDDEVTTTLREVRIDSSKQTLPVLRGTNPTADEFEEWSVTFEAVLSVMNQLDALENEWNIDYLRRKPDKTAIECARLKKNDLCYSYLFTATRDGP